MKSAAVRLLPVSPWAMALFVAAPALAQSIPVGPDKGVSGRAGPPSVAPLCAAASNIDGANTRPLIAPALPSVDPGTNAAAVGYRQAARSARAANQTGRGQSVVEMPRHCC